MLHYTPFAVINKFMAFPPITLVYWSKYFSFLLCWHQRIKEINIFTTSTYYTIIVLRARDNSFTQTLNIVFYFFKKISQLSFYFFTTMSISSYMDIRWMLKWNKNGKSTWHFSCPTHFVWSWRCNNIHLFSDFNNYRSKRTFHSCCVAYTTTYVIILLPVGVCIIFFRYNTAFKLYVWTTSTIISIGGKRYDHLEVTRVNWTLRIMIAHFLIGLKELEKILKNFFAALFQKMILLRLNFAVHRVGRQLDKNAKCC